MDLIVKNIGELVTGAGFKDKDGRKPVVSDLAILRNACMVIRSGRVDFVGPRIKVLAHLKKTLSPARIKKIKELDARGGTVLPGFVESHTHLVFAGDRKNEFELRNQGVSYTEVSAGGGGIKKTVLETRKASPSQLLADAQLRVDEFRRQGVTTLEAKSGYGLNVDSEIKILKTHRKLRRCRLISTFLGLHALPSDYLGRRREFVDEMVGALPLLKKKGLIDRVDIFIEKGFFECEEAQQLFAHARDLGLSITAHTEQLSYTGGVANVIKMQGASADHLVEIREDDVRSLARSNTVGVLLPTSDFYLKMKYPPARKMIDEGCAVALATDFNPGTSPSQDLSLVGVLARLEMKMTLPEVLCAYTYNASKAIGLQNYVGVLAPGFAADFIIADAAWDDFFYQVGRHPVHSTHFSQVF